MSTAPRRTPRGNHPQVAGEMKRKQGSIKWVGVAACAFLLCGWIGTFWSAFGYQTSTMSINLWGGCFETSVYPAGLPTQGWFALRKPYEAYWLPKVVYGWISGLRTTHLFVPLWIPLLLVGAATILASRHDWRIAPGCCQTCGYDLSHVNSDTCAECGTRISPTGSSRS